MSRSTENCCIAQTVSKSGLCLKRRCPFTIFKACEILLIRKPIILNQSIWTYLNHAENQLKINLYLRALCENYNYVIKEVTCVQYAHALRVFVRWCETLTSHLRNQIYLHMNPISFHFPLPRSKVCISVFYSLSPAPRFDVSERAGQLTLGWFHNCLLHKTTQS